MSLRGGRGWNELGEGKGGEEVRLVGVRGGMEQDKAGEGREGAG